MQGTVPGTVFFYGIARTQTFTTISDTVEQTGERHVWTKETEAFFNQWPVHGRLYVGSDGTPLTLRRQGQTLRGHQYDSSAWSYIPLSPADFATAARQFLRGTDTIMTLSSHDGSRKMQFAYHRGAMSIEQITLAIMQLLDGSPSEKIEVALVAPQGK